MLEICRAGTWPVIELYVDDSVTEQEKESIETMLGHDTPVHRESSDRIVELCHSKAHQGYLAKMAEYPYKDLREVIGNAHAGTGRTWIILDRVQDPYNTGAIIRSAEVLGIQGIIIPRTGQCGVNSMTARTSAGAVNRIPIARVDDLARSVAFMKEKGIRIAGADAGEGVPVYEYNFMSPAAVILGNEAQGIRPEIRSLCDTFIHIPRKGAIDSLNVAQAAAVICYEILRQHQA